MSPPSARTPPKVVPPAPITQPESLSALVETGPEAVSVVDSQWRFTYVNRAFERMADTSGQSVIGRSMWELYPFLDRTPFADELREVMRARSSARMKFRSEQGGVFDVHVTPFSDGIAFFTYEVTDLHRVTEELAQKEERLRTILNTAPGCVMLLDRQGTVLDLNPAGLAILEVDEYADVLGRAIEPFVSREDRYLVAALTERVFGGGEATIVFEIIGCRGTRRRVEHHAVPLRNGRGEIVAAVSNTTDITHRYESEAALRHRANQHAALAALGGLAMRDHDVDDLTHRAVEAVSEALRVPRRAALDLLRKHGLVGIQRTSGEGPSGGVKLELEDADFVRSVAHLVTTAAERRRAEDALRERDEQLRQAQKMEAIGQLAGGVAHDFNNLLTVINVHTDLLLMNLTGADSRRNDVEEIARAAARAASLTRQLLTFSRKGVVQPQVLDLGRVAGGVEPMLRRLIGEDVDFEVVLHPPIEQVLADEGEIEQVLINLVVNARDAMPQGGRLRVEVRNMRVDDALCAKHPSLRPGEYVQLTVRDTGMGMTSETMARAFEPFFTTKEPGRGTGLGLATVYGIVKQCGGAITVESEPGSGTTFCVYVPVARGVDHKVEGVVERRHVAVAGETILLVEDEDSVRHLAKRVLESQGYTVLEAINGEDALRIAADYGGVIDLLLSDVVMPELGGRLVAERLVGARPETAVLFMSGYTDDEILRRGLLERGQRMIQKPFTATALAHEVRSALDARLRRRSAAHTANVDE